MTTSGVIGFNLDILDVIEEAYERCSVEKQKLTADHLQSARRSLNLLLQSWANVNERPWAVDKLDFTVSAGNADEALPSDTIDILEATCKRDDHEIPMTRISRSDYHALPDKTIQGRPDRFWLHKDRERAVMYLYQTPENSTDEIHYWRIRELQTVTSYADNPDVLGRWLDALCAGLALRLYGKLPKDLFDAARYAILKGEATEAFDLANTEDRDRAPLEVVPFNYMRGRR